MVIYEREHDWVMISQHHHGLLSGDIARHWNKSFLKENEYQDEVIFAISQHDRGWIDLDETPFWNDKDKRPYSFIDFPLVPKLTFYQRGIDEVQRHSPYAGLLCSLHYHAFLASATEPAAIEFTKQEKQRQQHLKKKLHLYGKEKEELLKLHFLMIQFCDDLSLYLCIQEPGIPKAEEFPWFKDGFSEMFPFFHGQKVMAEWLNPEKVALSPSPLASAANLSVKVKVVEKEQVQQSGIAKAYKQADWTERTFTIS